MEGAARLRRPCGSRKSYSGATLDDLREAIDRLPRIDWIEPKHGSVTPIRVREQVGEVAGRSGTAGDNVVALPKLR